jgi:cysteine synthase
LIPNETYDEARGISEEEGRAMSRRLAREEGVFVVAAIALVKELGSDKTVVTVAADTGLKYLKGNLLADA